MLRISAHRTVHLNQIRFLTTARDGCSRSPRMLQPEHQKTSIDRKDDTHEQKPPDAKIFPSAVAALFLRRQRGISRAPDDAIDLFRLRRTSRQRNTYHCDHAKNPS